MKKYFHVMVRISVLMIGAMLGITPVCASPLYGPIIDGNVPLVQVLLLKKANLGESLLLVETFLEYPTACVAPLQNYMIIQGLLENHCNKPDALKVKKESKKVGQLRLDLNHGNNRLNPIRQRRPFIAN